MHYKRTSPRPLSRGLALLWILGLLASLTLCPGCGASELQDGGSGAASSEAETGLPSSSQPEPQESAEEPEWNLILVNPWNPVPEDYQVTLVDLINGEAVDARCYPDLQAMMDACRAEGFSPLICSSYRSLEYQEGLFGQEVERLMAQGLTLEEAQAETATTIAVPGTSEHQLGLAVDIVDLNYQILDESQEDTPVQQWLMEHCWEYGFILRYPPEKSEITGIIYEPWHYRYVGREAAEEITQAGLCLEEYLEDYLTE